MSLESSDHSQSLPPGSLATDLQESSIHPYGCKWAWCRSTFSDSRELVHHVIHEHARRAIPVRRRDIALIRRTEEGTGESLKISYLINGKSSNSVIVEPSTTQLSQDVETAPTFEPSSSLPSPPASSPTSLSNAQPFPENKQLPTSPRTQNQDSTEPMDVEPMTSSAVPLPSTPDIRLSQQQIRDSTPTFASLSSPAGLQASLATPNSPSFSSLVSKPMKCKLAFDTPENPSPRKSNFSRYHTLTNSQSSSRSSTGSQMAVEQQLTQSLDEFDGESDSNSNTDALGEDGNSGQQPLEPHETIPEVSGAPAASLTSNKERSMYKSELNWALSQPETSQSLPDSQSQSSLQETESGGSHPDLLTQPPSQFKQSPATSFPIHLHGPKKSPTKPSHAETEPESSAPLHFSSPAPLPSHTFAVSTPQGQPWYQQPLRRTRSGKKDEFSAVDEGISTPSPAQPDRPVSRSQGRHSRSLSKSNVFRSGTLQITPVAAAREPIAEEPENAGQPHMRSVESQSQDNYGDYMDSSQSLQHYSDSYPLLQTQAPYESQSMMQF